MKVNECMCHDVLWVNPGTSVCDCASLMAEHKIGCVPHMSSPQGMFELRMELKQMPGGCAFEHLDGVRQTALRLRFDQQMDMVRHGFHCVDLNIQIGCDFCQQPFQICLNRPGQHWFSVLRDHLNSLAQLSQSL